ncbi:Vms1/Ankzf1 family peptidyl-tRNA hydrolase [Chloroflexota bacterium]
MEKATFTKEQLLRFLAQLDSSQEHYHTVYMKSSSFLVQRTELTAKVGLFADEIVGILTGEDVLMPAQLYGTGAVIFWSNTENKNVILPPFSVLEDIVSMGRPETIPLRQLLEKERTLGLVLVAWGSYAIGVAKGNDFVEYKKGTGHIHRRHRKGGSSSKRFARRIEEQKNEFLRRVAKRVEEKFQGYSIEQIYFGGNRLILKPLLEECPYLKSEVNRISKRFLSVRYADSEALSDNLAKINASQVFSYAKMTCKEG